MSDTPEIVALLVLVAVLCAAYYAYDKCHLNKYLATKHQKTCPAGSGGGSFVGAMAQHPHLAPLAFPAGQSWAMNRGNYV